jgi:hypothetical protein
LGTQGLADPAADERICGVVGSAVEVIEVGECQAADRGDHNVAAMPTSAAGTGMPG